MMVLNQLCRMKRAFDGIWYVKTCRALAKKPIAGSRSAAWTQVRNAHLWAHAGGGRLHLYGNSQEAYDDAIQCGFGVIEADVMLTVDAVPVMTHRFRPRHEIVFDKTPTEKEFLSCPVNDRYTPLTLDGFIRRYESANAFFSIDPSPSVRAVDMGQAVIEFLKRHASEDFLRRIVYQIDGLAQLALFQRENPFGALHYNLDAEINRKCDRWKIPHLIPALKATGVASVSIVDMPIDDENEMRKILAAFNAADIKVSIASVNSMERFRRWRGLGAFCINTDYLYPEMFKGGEL